MLFSARSYTVNVSVNASMLLAYTEPSCMILICAFMYLMQ